MTSATAMETRMELNAHDFQNILLESYGLKDPSKSDEAFNADEDTIDDLF